MIAVDAWLGAAPLSARLIMQVHDELVLEVVDAELDNIIPHLRMLMADAALLRVPLKVDIGVGRNWDEAH
jgi:DNA polymerase-1